MIEAGGNTEPAVDACVVLCRYVWNSVRFQKGDKLTAPDIEKEVSKVPTFFDLYRIGDDRFEPQHTLVKLAGLVEVKRRDANVGKSFVTHRYYSSRLDPDDSGDTSSLASGVFTVSALIGSSR